MLVTCGDTIPTVLKMSINAQIGKYCSRRKFYCNKFSGNEGSQATGSATTSSLPLKRKTSLFANKHFAKKTTNATLVTPKQIDHVDEDSGFCDDLSNNNSVGKLQLALHQPQ